MGFPLLASFGATLPSVFHLLKIAELSHLLMNSFLFVILSAVEVYIVFHLANVHHLNWKLPHRLYIALS